MSIKPLDLCFYFFSFFFAVVSSSAQTKTQNTYLSKVDADLTVRTVLVAPVEDNVSGIYAHPVEENLKELIAHDPQWTPSEFKNFSTYKTNTFYTNPKEVSRLANDAQADAILKVRITKGPSGINSKLTLFSGRDGLPMVEESIENYEKFEISSVNIAFEKALKNLKDKMPYRAEVLSRRGQEITFNAGRNRGIKNGSDVSMIQILKVNRHPKLNFIVSSEKEILGKARVFKVDDTLSFAHLLMEREPGVIQVGTKVMPDEYIQYSEPYITADGQILTDLDARKDKDVSYGEKPEEWLPEAPAQYGKVDALIGITQYTQSSAFQSSGTVEGTNNMAPTLAVNGEFWISPKWYVGMDLRSAAFSVPNNLSHSSPDTINMTINSYNVHFGYNFLLSPDFFGPKIQLGAGLSKYTARADETSPITFTNMDFGGIAFLFSGQFPITDDNKTDLGARFKYYWNPTVTESKSSGSSSSVKITDFSAFMAFHQRPKFSYIGELRFEYYSASFTGGGDRPETVSSISQKLTTLLFGVQYLF